VEINLKDNVAIFNGWKGKGYLIMCPCGHHQEQQEEGDLRIGIKHV
jgi:hypothetical protein